MPRYRGIAHARRPRRVKKRNTCCESALPLSADSSRTALEVRFVPNPEVEDAIKLDT
jgi:hypothetical protein